VWRAVDEDGNVLNILMQRHHRNKAAAKVPEKLLKAGVCGG